MSGKRKNTPTSIMEFFPKVAKKTDPVSSGSDDCTAVELTEATKSNVSLTSNSNVRSPDSLDVLPTCTVTRKYDIGVYLDNIDVLPAAEKARLLRDTWTPDRAHKFEPQTIGTKKRTFQLSWLERFQWLAYSDAAAGAFCKVCVLFAPKSSMSTAMGSVGVGKGGHQIAGSLVLTPFKNWKNAIESFQNHSSKKFHKDAAVDAANFLDIYDGKRDDISLQLNKSAQEIIAINKKKLIAIIQTIYFCGRQEIALRGHFDSGRVLLADPEYNDGNFRALLRYRATHGDHILEEHIKTSRGNALYTSPQIQNEIIEIIGMNIQKAIIDRLSKAKFFTVLADETTDVQRIEQFSLCIRYVDYGTMDLREDFLEFVPVFDVTGAGLAKTIKERLVHLGLDLALIRGQGYDGAAAMSGEFRGVQALIQAEFPMAVYTHCSAHCLNLCLNDASKIVPIRSCFSVISEVCVFFRASARRSAILKEKLKNSPITSSGLMKYCETRWVERHDAVALFTESSPYVIEALEELIEAKKDDATKAQVLHNSLCSFNCIIALKVCEKMLSLTHALSEYLQSKSLDLCKAMAHVDLVRTRVADMRAHADTEFAVLFQQASDVASSLGVTPTIPRRAGTQKYRSNHPADSPEEYYRRSLFVPYLDDLGGALEDRFIRHKEKIVSLQCLVPAFLEEATFENLKPAIDFYRDDLKNPNQAILEGEWDVWAMKWKSTDSESPKCAISALKVCDKNLFPNIQILLTLLATLPVTTASVERSFSTLKRIKTYLRNRTSENRLTGLALMTIHRDIKVDEKSVLDIFAEKSRRMLLS